MDHLEVLSTLYISAVFFSTHYSLGSSYVLKGSLLRVIYIPTEQMDANKNEQ